MKSRWDRIDASLAAIKGAFAQSAPLIKSAYISRHHHVTVGQTTMLEPGLFLAPAAKQPNPLVRLAFDIVRREIHLPDLPGVAARQRFSVVVSLNDDSIQTFGRTGEELGGYFIMRALPKTAEEVKGLRQDVLRDIAGWVGRISHINLHNPPPAGKPS